MGSIQVFQYGVDAFEAAQTASVSKIQTVDVVGASRTSSCLSLLLAGTSLTSLARALLCQDFVNALLGFPEAELSGQQLLGCTDLRSVKNLHLACPRVRFLQVPEGASAMAERINWMWHAGSLPTDADTAARSAEAIDVMIAQVAPHGEFDPETLADDLSSHSENYARVVDALFRGDLDDVPGLIDEAAAAGFEVEALVQSAAWMFVCWAGLECQREACHGWRQKHVPLNGAWGQSDTNPWTLGQVFRLPLEQYEFAHEMKTLYEANRASGNDRVTDKRTINKVERKLRKFGLGCLNRLSEQDVLALFGAGRGASLFVELEQHAATADTYHRHYCANLKTPDGKSRAGKHADALFARISCVDRLAIVAARTCALAEKARTAQCGGDLREMLDSQLPDILRPLNDKRESLEKLRMRQLFHVFRVEFLLDGEHLPKAAKNRSYDKLASPALEFGEPNRQRGHEIFDGCWKELQDQPPNWRFLSPFGWECDGRVRVRFSASL